MRFGQRFFFPSLYRKIKDQNPSISEDFTKTFLKWPRDRLETMTSMLVFQGGKTFCASFCASLIACVCSFSSPEPVVSGYKLSPVALGTRVAFVCVVLWDSLKFIRLLRAVFSSQQRLNRPTVNAVQWRHSLPENRVVTLIGWLSKHSHN